MAQVTLHVLLPATAQRLSQGDMSSLADAPNLPQVEAAIRIVAASTFDLYQRRRSIPPWLGYLARDEAGQLVGTAAFVGPPERGAVEIAYHTFPDYEGRGIATAMAEQLLTIARRNEPELGIIAFTRPETNASTEVLSRLGFVRAGFGTDEEIGRTWRWELAASQRHP